MNKVMILTAMLFISNRHVSAQQSKYDIALSSGFYQAPNYQHAVNRPFLAADFDYHLLKRWTISTGFLSGQFAYFEDWRSNMVIYTNYTNAKGYESHMYLTASYSVVCTSNFLVQCGSGMGLFTQRLKYPFREPSSGGSPRGSSGYGADIFTAEESYSIAEVPFKIEGFYMLGTRIGLGVRAGTYIQFNRPLAGTYLGPQVRIRL